MSEIDNANFIEKDKCYLVYDDFGDFRGVVLTADVVEVVHGKWIPSRFKTLQEEGWFECSVCGVGNKLYDRGIRKSDVPYIDGKPYELKNIVNYCPNCGARMDGKKDDKQRSD